MEDSILVIQSGLGFLPDADRVKALDSIWPVLGEVLNKEQTNPILYQRAVISVTFVTELIHQVSKDKLSPLVQSLLGGLRNPEVTIPNKAQVVSSMADVMMSMGTSPPEAAMDQVLASLADCHAVAVDDDDEEEVQERDELFEAVAYAYTSLAQVAGDDGGIKYSGVFS